MQISSLKKKNDIETYHWPSYITKPYPPTPEKNKISMAFYLLMFSIVFIFRSVPQSLVLCPKPTTIEINCSGCPATSKLIAGPDLSVITKFMYALTRYN